MNKDGVSINLTEFRFIDLKQNVLVISNNTGGDVTFKLKTSTPTRYQVKPRAGCIVNGGEEKITISPRGTEVPPSSQDKLDRFQLEVRSLNANEIKAREFALKDMIPEAREALSAPPDVQFDDFSNFIWKYSPTSKGIEARKFVLECHFGNDPAPSYNTPARALGTDVTEMATARVNETPATRATTADYVAKKIEKCVEENQSLKAELKRLTAKKDELKSKNKIHYTAADEIKSKVEKSGVAVPGWLFCILFLLAFYMGLVMDRYLM
eukprot:TRINITY_DN2034_c9_g1_i1.p1 TRINITY_DN2034_c9_g1~~TRINITY_DN2034_c9_g1_i1.p1  ORF type:complete len:267 (+),score=49.25 TRINITY_DN2034_c9_g1_i1:45-845(+)